MTPVDDFRDAILDAKEDGASISGIARTLGLPRTTVQNALDRWARPDRPSPGEDALEALRRLVKD